MWKSSTAQWVLQVALNYSNKLWPQLSKEDDHGIDVENNSAPALLNYHLIRDNASNCCVFFFPTALFVNLRIWFQLCELMFFPHWLCICEFVSNSAACFKLQAPTNQINCCVQLSPLFVIRKFKYKIKHTFSNKYSNTQAQNSGVEIKTSQELRMLSRSLSDCKSLLLNVMIQSKSLSL